MGIDGTWLVTGLAVGGELQPPLRGSVLTLTFDGDVLTGYTGLSEFRGGVGGDSLFGSLRVEHSTGPHALMAQEAIFLRHLEEADAIEVDNEGISLARRGLLLVTLVPAPDPPGTSALVETF